MATKPIKNTVTIYNFFKATKPRLCKLELVFVFFNSVNIPKFNNPQINDPTILEAIRKLKRSGTFGDLKIPERKHFDLDFKSP